MFRRALTGLLSVNLIPNNRGIRRAIRDILGLTAGRISVDRNRLQFRVIQHYNNDNACIACVDNPKTNRRRHLHAFTNNRHVKQIKFRRTLMFNNNANVVTLLNRAVNFNVLQQRLLDAHTNANNADTLNNVKVEVAQMQHNAIRAELYNNLGSLQGRLINGLLRLIIAQGTLRRQRQATNGRHGRYKHTLRLRHLNGQKVKQSVSAKRLGLTIRNVRHITRCANRQRRTIVNQRPRRRRSQRNHEDLRRYLRNIFNNISRMPADNEHTTHLTKLNLSLVPRHLRVSNTHR